MAYSKFSIAGANESYIYAKDANVSIGTGTDEKIIKFFTDGTLATNERMRISKTGIAMKSPLGYYNVTTSQRLALVDIIPKMINIGGIVFDTDIECLMMLVDLTNNIWIQV